MTEHTHTPEDTERIEFVELEEPFLCEVCPNRADFAFQYKTKLGQAHLCEECMRVITSLGVNELEWGHEDE